MNRRQKSGGQAIVLVTLALLAMCGMMGLSVDLGWSFFVQKQAQTAADAAALASVQEAMNRLGGNGAVVSAFTCAVAGTAADKVDCQGTAVNCAAVTATSNLNNGCQYAKKNGFDWTTSRQNVTIQSNDGLTGNLPVTSPGVINLAYWTTVRTVQTIPQLFSAVMNRTEGTVSAVGTAAIAGSVAPGSFYGMNRRGDCTNSPDGPHCGTDISTGTGGGQSLCPAPNPNNVNGSVCAPAGILLASSCNAVLAGVCDDGYAGNGTGAGVAGGSLTVMTGGVVTGDYHNMKGQPLAVTPSSDLNQFRDFYHDLSQPPLQASHAAGPIQACGYPGGIVPPTVTTLGPFQYYSYNAVTGLPDANPIKLPDGVTFSTGQGICPGAGAVQTGGSNQTSGLPSYIFWGGLLTNSTATFGPGQYVMAGTKSGTGAVFSVGGALSGNGNSTITGDTSTGTAFIFTDGHYPGLASQKANFDSGNVLDNVVNGTQLYQGTLAFKNSTINLTGMVNNKNAGSSLPSELNAYSGIAWWQDRRNSYGDGYDEDPSSGGCSITPGDCTADTGYVLYCADNGDCPIQSTAKLNAMKTANHVTPTSAGVELSPGNVQMNMSGAFYQPRGAWLYIKHGTGSLGGPLQFITGALVEDTGDTNLLLSGPTNPIITYKAVLIH